MVHVQQDPIEVMIQLGADNSRQIGHLGKIVESMKTELSNYRTVMQKLKPAEEDNPYLDILQRNDAIPTSWNQMQFIDKGRMPVEFAIGQSLNTNFFNTIALVPGVAELAGIFAAEGKPMGKDSPDVDKMNKRFAAMEKQYQTLAAEFAEYATQFDAYRHRHVSYGSRGVRGPSTN
ncbi:MAG: hypothetical protein HYS81_02910 [Candidatus Aenigmatarchaeota archaeon]|nr:MAG: hypothetical protein HYS81_02910 [Candidatus Aenigmarchaeota archaeon]